MNEHGRAPPISHSCARWGRASASRSDIASPRREICRAMRSFGRRSARQDKHSCPRLNPPCLPDCEAAVVANTSIPDEQALAGSKYMIQVAGQMRTQIGRCGFHGSLLYIKYFLHVQQSTRVAHTCCHHPASPKPRHPATLPDRQLLRTPAIPYYINRTSSLSTEW